MLSAIEELNDQSFKHSHSIVLTNDKWHQGVVGILASRLKEKFFRPTIIFANFNEYFAFMQALYLVGIDPALQEDIEIPTGLPTEEN